MSNMKRQGEGQRMRILIDIGGAEMSEGGDVAEVLQKIANRVEDWGDLTVRNFNTETVMDINGNTVAAFCIREDV